MGRQDVLDQRRRLAGGERQHVEDDSRLRIGQTQRVIVRADVAAKRPAIHCDIGDRRIKCAVVALELEQHGAGRPRTQQKCGGRRNHGYKLHCWDPQMS